MRTFLFFLWAGLLIGCQSGPRVFYPLGIYSPGVVNNFPEIRSAGFNLVTGEAKEQFLHSAKGNDLRVLASIATTPGPDFSTVATERVVRKFDSSPQIWAWYVVDEPDLNE